MMTIIDSGGMGKVGFSFDNGIRLSCIFNDMSYSDNYDLWKKDGVTDFDRQKKQGFVNSTTVELMVTDGNMAFNKWISRKYGTYESDSDPIAYVPVSALPAILKRADSKVYAKADTPVNDLPSGRSDTKNRSLRGALGANQEDTQ